MVDIGEDKSLIGMLGILTTVVRRQNASIQFLSIFAQFVTEKMNEKENSSDAKLLLEEFMKTFVEVEKEHSEFDKILKQVSDSLMRRCGIDGKSK